MPAITRPGRGYIFRHERKLMVQLPKDVAGVDSKNTAG